MARFSLLPRDDTFFDLFIEAGQNTVNASRLLDQTMQAWPESRELTREILQAEQEGDRITHDIIQRLNTTFVTPIDREDIYGLATQMDDIVDFTEEAADFLGLYQIEAPMEQAQALSAVLVASCEQLAMGLEKLPSFKDLDRYWIEIHRLENEGDRISRDAVASLFSNGVDPMVVIRWKDIFEVLEEAIDATASREIRSPSFSSRWISIQYWSRSLNDGRLSSPSASCSQAPTSTLARAAACSIGASIW